MNQPPPVQSIKPPQTTIVESPHLVVGEQKRGKGAIFGIVVLSLMLLGIPIGIFLLPKQTQLTPQAAVTEKVPEIAGGIFLESKLSNSADGTIPVDIFVKSPLDAVNLVNAKIKFDPSAMSLDKIATSSGTLNSGAEFSKWIEVSVDNVKGLASVISGAPTPGIKTGESGSEKIYLATLNFKPKKTSSSVIQILPESQLLRNSDSLNIFKNGNDLALSLTEAPANATSSAKLNKDPKTSEPLIVVTNPLPAANYSYFKPVDITWSSFNVTRISDINLYLNGELLGPIARNLEAQSGKFDWQPQESLALPYIQLANTYAIEIVGVSKDGAVAKTLSAPFGVLGTDQVIGSPPNPEVFSQNQLSVSDVSRTLANYLVLPLKEPSLDLNKDGAINDLDLFLIRENLLVRGVIK